MWDSSAPVPSGSMTNQKDANLRLFHVDACLLTDTLTDMETKDTDLRSQVEQRAQLQEDDRMEIETNAIMSKVEQAANSLKAAGIIGDWDWQDGQITFLFWGWVLWDYSAFLTWADRIAAYQRPEVEQARRAIKRQVENIERWLETGQVADEAESKSIYDELRAALDAMGEKA